MTDALSAEMLTLPLWSHMPFDSVDRVCAAIARLYDHRDALAGVAADGGPSGSGPLKTLASAAKGSPDPRLK